MRLFPTTSVLVAALSGCNSFNPTVVSQDPDAAFLSVARSSSTTWVTGAQRTPQGPGVLLRNDQDGWTEIETNTPHDLWWVHAFDDGTAFVGGGGATVLSVDGDTVSRTPTPEFFGNTVFGVWGMSPDDVWAVGGWAGRAGFAWHYDGSTWTEAALPLDLPRRFDGATPALLKVWGRASDDVWMVGGEGLVLHWDGSEFERIDVGQTAPLFAVSGNESETVIVGGDGQGLVLRGGLDGFSEDTPPGSPLLQGVTYDGKGRLWVTGGRGFVARSSSTDDWRTVDLELEAEPQSLHAAVGIDDGIWAVGGRVLDPALDDGVIVAPDALDVFTPPEPAPIATTCPPSAIDPVPDGSIARRWNEALLNSIRRDIPHPPKHARNLLHTSAAVWDAWAAYDDGNASGIFSTDELSGTPADRDIAISHAAHRVMRERYSDAIGNETTMDCYDELMAVLGLDPSDTRTEGDDPVAVGNRIGQAVLDATNNDGSNNLVDTTGWEPANSVMIVDNSGTNVEDPDVWQQLNLGTAETQNGIVLDTSVQPYIAAHWREVTPFAIERDPVTGLYGQDVDLLPSVDDPSMGQHVLEVIRKTSELSIDDGTTLDIGPASRGDNPLGTNDGSGYDLNPVTGQPYAPNVVLRGDFTRVVAEMWADGPSSETPPGHWIKLGNEVSDRLQPDDLQPYGGPVVDRLTWDVGMYLVVSGSVHDAAITAWEMKRESLGPRPITLVRWMAQQGQQTETDAADYDPRGLPLETGLVERITEASSAPGERHFPLRWYVGELAVRSWPGEPGDRNNDYTPLAWMRAVDWIPYQRRTFVTPAFPGYVSGHSTFSRAAAEAMTAYTDTPWFPGGLHSFTAPQNDYLVFEQGPSTPVTLQWATYRDAADEAGQSRLWGGIHIFPDDEIGRTNGDRVGRAVVERARSLYGIPAPEPQN